ncbi:ATP-dependent zinc protease family protein [Desulfoluna butyratoxydans]|uniref:Putative atp-dependant zinc protease n=1 Tax=Desulfoluna butyratoxydans TaxID=231438 RepID=A0A4U8YUH5_9BACT|nr:RimK/LysX family protein [Desulfoluna butyratoxydans]VFQ44993.1 putative atp-dependant zinc protease [Desulfoluna butyratoxydans]
MKKTALVFTRLFVASSVAIMCVSCAGSRSHPDIPADRRVIGEVEPVTLVDAGITLPARIDTGATSCSLDATNIERFERDGKKWVRFTLTDKKTGDTHELEKKLSRTVKITRHGEESQRRPVVKMKAMLGGVSLYKEFTLTDRSEFTYQVLIGRNFLEGEFIVDVTLKNVTTPMGEE